MTPDWTVFLTTAAVLLVVAASGPLVPGVAFTTGTADAAADYRAFGEESTGMGVEKRLAFGAVTLPDGGTLAPTGDGGYRVEFDPVELLVETATTPATVRYAVRIPSLGFGREATERVPARTGRTVRLAAPDGAVPADRVTEGRYGATLAVSVELSDRTLSVAETTVPLEVER